MDLCAKMDQEKTVVRQYFSPPPSLRLHERSPDIEKLQENLLLDVDSERLAQGILTESDSPAFNHIVIPKRTNTSPIDPTRRMHLKSSC